MTRLVLTFGKNPLPVLVAARRLCEHFRESDFTITPIFSGNSESEYGRVKEHLSGMGLDLTWNEVGRVLPGDPASISAAIERIDAGDDYHLHYTGGTKAMAVHAMSALALKAGREGKHFEASYLDPNEHTVIGWNMNPPLSAVPDERAAWALDPKSLAELHGMTVPDRAAEEVPVAEAKALWDFLLKKPEFLQQYIVWKGVWSAAFGGRGNCVAPDPAKWPAELLEWMRSAVPNCDNVEAILEAWSAAFCGEHGTKPPGPKKWPRKPIEWMQIEALGWDGVTAILRAKFGGGAWTGDAIEPLKFAPGSALKPWWEFIVGGLDLEAYAFGELRAALPEKFRPSVVSSFKPVPADSVADCEIDVAAVVGYQLIAVSCTNATGRGECKKRGFEVWLRARQIGGDAARAILLCPCYPPKDEDGTDELEADLNKDIGARGADGEDVRMVRVWHRLSMPWGGSLKDKFKRYLREDLRCHI
jgi:hypothetical protein